MTTRLTEEQRKVVETWGRGLAVMAGAGAGKTTTLVLKCQELMRRNPEARFAAVSFTERSASDLKAKLAEKLESKSGNPLDGHWVMTIHGLCGAILREYPREAGFDGEESMLAEPEARALWDRAVQEIWFGNPDREALDRLLERESRDSLMDLLRRTRELAGFGAIGFLERSEDQDSRALAVLASWVLGRYEQFKRRAGALDFNDLEHGADRALESPAVRQAFQERFDLVLVDEFQDTNPVQARIIRKFCREEGSNLCVVGDPKQSIYRFRDADVSLFEEFCAALPEKAELTANFRSRPGILDFVNVVCEPAFEASQLRYEPLKPSREPSEELSPVLRLDIREPEELARWIASERAKGAPLSDMALLLRRIRGSEKWLKALSAAGIPLAVGSGGLFWEDPRIREFVAFLKWWDNPANTFSGAVFLRAPWMGISDSEIDRWIAVDRTLQRSFLESSHPLATKLRALRRKVVRPAELLMELVFDQKTEDELGAPILGLWHRIEDLSMRGMNFHAAVTEVARAVEESRRERDVPPPKNQGQLSILTLHSSKGLEFPRVILIDFGQKGREPNAPLLFWDREKGTFLGPRDAEGDRDKENPLEQEWRAREREKTLAESKRLFYVALTRAREQLVLVCPELPQPKATAKPKEPKPPFTVDDWRGWIEACAEKTQVQQVDGTQLPAPSRVADKKETRSDETSSDKVWIYRRPRHSVTEWNLLSGCPRAYEWRQVRPKIVAASDDEGARGGEGDVSTGGLSGQELGSRVHGCLEVGDWDGLRAIEAQVGPQRFSAEPLIEWAGRSKWMSPDQETLVELAFEMRIEGETLVGAIDRTVRLPSGEWAVLDFKVNRTSKTPQSLLDSYQTQLELYVLALRTLLPPDENPTIQAWILEISPTGVQEVQVPLRPQFAKDVTQLARLSAAIVSGEKAVPKPGSLCKFCEFRASCPEAL